MFTANDLNFLDGETFDPTKDSLDGMETFDPKGSIVDMERKSRGIFNSSKGKEGIITLRIKNNTASTRRFELFNALKHITKIPNPSQYANTNNYNPLSTGFLAAYARVNGIFAPNGGPGEPNTNLYYVPDFAIFDDVTGDLCYCNAGNDGTAIPTLKAIMNNPNGGSVNWSQLADVTVSCSQLPYRQLLDSFSSMVWRINKTKLQTSSENQVKNAFDFVYYSPFGGQENNSFEPSEFFLPQNQQTKVIDIPKKYEVDANTAIYVNLEPNEDMKASARAFAASSRASLSASH